MRTGNVPRGPVDRRDRLLKRMRVTLQEKDPGDVGGWGCQVRRQ